MQHKGFSEELMKNIGNLCFHCPKGANGTSFSQSSTNLDCLHGVSWNSCRPHLSLCFSIPLDVAEREKDAENPSKKLRLIYTCGTLRTKKQCPVPIPRSTSQNILVLNQREALVLLVAVKIARMIWKEGHPTFKHHLYWLLNIGRTVTSKICVVRCWKFLLLHYWLRIWKIRLVFLII